MYSVERIQAFLDSPCQAWGGDRTWRDWMADVLITLVDEGESFSGKRPNCDSGWEWNVAEGLGAAGLIDYDPANEDGPSPDWGKMTQAFAAVTRYALGIESAPRES